MSGRARWLAGLTGLLVAAGLVVGAPPASADPPSNGELPQVTGMQANGDVYVGSTLHATAGRWSGVPAPTYTYRWEQRTADGNWPAIAGADESSYEVQPSDFGLPIRVNVTATNPEGSPSVASAATTAVKNGPNVPVDPVDPPADVLGTPANSRVVSSDELLVTLDNWNGSFHRQGGDVVGTDATGATEPYGVVATGEVETAPHAYPRLTAVGRYGDQDYDTVLSLEGGIPPMSFELGQRMVLRSANADRMTWEPGSTVASFEAGKTYRISIEDGQCPYEVGCLLTELSRPRPATNVFMTVYDDDGGELNQNRLAPQTAWTAVGVVEAGPGVLGIVNRASGRCLSYDGGAQPVSARDCDLTNPSQQWRTPTAGDGIGPQVNIVNVRSGLSLTRAGNRELTMEPLDRTSTTQAWSGHETPSGYPFPGSGQDVRNPRHEVPTYGFNLDTATYALAGGDLDRLAEHGDIYEYHDEAVMALVRSAPPGSGIDPRPPIIRVVDYVASGAVRPVPLDLDTDLPIPGTLRDDTYYAGSVNLAVGDYDGDSLNEIAYTWQDDSGTFRVTMLAYRAPTPTTRTLEVVGPAEGVPLFTGTGAPIPVLKEQLADTRAADLDGDGRDDLAIAFGASPAAGGPTSGYLGAVSFTQDLAVRGQQYDQLSTGPLLTDGPDATTVTRGLRLAPGLFRLDPDVGYEMERRQLAVAWTDTAGAAHRTSVGVFSIEPDTGCTQAVCGLGIDALAAPEVVQTATPPGNPEYPLPLSFTAGGFKGRGDAGTPPTWGMALSINDVGEDRAHPADARLYSLAVSPDAGASSGFSTAVLKQTQLEPGAQTGTTQLHTVTAFDADGDSLVLGAPAVVQVQKLERTTMVAAQPPTHADWDPDLIDQETGKQGGFLNVSRFSNFKLTLGSSSTKTYQHTHTHDTSTDAGITEDLDVKGSFTNDLVVEKTTGSLEVKQKFDYKWNTKNGDFSNTESQTSTSLTQTSDDDDLVQGSIEDSTLYRYPILGGPLEEADGDRVTGQNCGQECYGVYEVVIPGQVQPIATSGRAVDFYQPTWENGNALSYPVMTGGRIPTPDLGSYSYLDQDGNTQSVGSPLFEEVFGVGGSSATKKLEISSTTGSGNSSGGGTSWDVSADVKASGSYRLGTKEENFTGSASLDIGGFGNSETSTDDTGETINTSDSSFDLEVPEIVTNNGYNVGTAYYYDTSGAARVSMGVDLTSNAAGKEWWAENYGEVPDPALNMPNRMILIANDVGQAVIPRFATDAGHQAIRGFQALHTEVPDNPSFSGKPWSANPVVGDEVRFEVPVRNYALVPAQDVSVSFYAVPMTYQGLVPKVAGAPVRIGAPQRVDEIPAQGSALVSSPTWRAAVQAGVTGIQPWRIFVVLDEDDTIEEVHEWKDEEPPCPILSLDPQPSRGSVVNGVMVDPMTGKASTLACGQNNQGFGDISVAASAPTGGTALARETMTVLDLAGQTEADVPQVRLTGGGVLTADPRTSVMGPGEVARVRRGETVHAAAYVAADDESAYHQNVLVYDGPPRRGELVAATTLRGATAADGHLVPFTWTPDRVGRHVLHVKLLGHVAAGEDDLVRIPVRVGPTTPDWAPRAVADRYLTWRGKALTTRAPGVLRNDRKGQRGSLVAVLVDGPRHGSVRLRRNGAFTYEPDRGFTGRDRFTYRAGDGALVSDPARVRIRVRSAPECQGRRATIIGTRRGEVIRGTAGDDVVVALGGGDTVVGRGGEDRVCAGAGRDDVRTGAGDDRVEAGRGRDLVDGGAGADRLWGGPGDDLLVGGAGTDVLRGGPGTDTLVRRSDRPGG